MPLASMTGHGRAEGADQRVTWAWEARSVNGKSLEIRCRIPPGFDRLEAPARATAAQRFRRGNVTLSLSLVRAQATAPVRINRELLKTMLALVEELRGHAGVAPATADGLLRVRGIVEPEDEMADDTAKIEARDKAMLVTLDQAVERLIGARQAEGAHLREVLQGHLSQIEMLCQKARAVATAQPAAIRDRMHRQLNDMLGSVPALSEERFAQEVAMLIQKADIREELDRLTAHLAQAATLITAGEAGESIGRKFDFLCQEFNREANTLCSKSGDIELTRLGIELKSVVEQLREQVQNVE